MITEYLKPYSTNR